MTIELRWALANREGHLLGLFCWPGASKDRMPTTQTFRTRAIARAERARSCYPRARIVRVRVTVEVAP